MPRISSVSPPLHTPEPSDIGCWLPRSPLAQLGEARVDLLLSSCQGTLHFDAAAHSGVFRCATAPVTLNLPLMSASPLQLSRAYSYGIGIQIGLAPVRKLQCSCVRELDDIGPQLLKIAGSLRTTTVRW